MRSTAGRLLVALCLTTPALSASACAYVRNSQSSLEQAQAALDAGDEAEAEAIYRGAMTDKRDKDRVEAKAMLIDLLIRRGGRLLEAGNAGDAMGHYRDALALDPAHDVSRISYARALMRVERFTEAIDVLMEGQGCRGCKSLIAVIYLERANTEIRDGDYVDALADYDMALSMSRDPLTVLAKVDVYTLGQHGSGSEAVAYLDHALRLIPPDQAGVQRLWWDKRMAVLYAAALAGEHGALDEALALEDPRRSLSPEQRAIERLELHMYVASLQIYAKAFELGTARGKRAYAEAEAAAAIPAAERTKLRTTLIGLYQQRVAVHLADDDDGAARAVLAEALAIADDDEILNFQNILATAARNTGEARRMLGDYAGRPEYERMRALVEAVYARKMMEIGQFTAARSAVEKAERYAPDLLETHLVRAELETETRFADLKKTWAERFRELDTYDYPGGRINNYGRALAELRHVQAHTDAAAARDPLRAPGFAKRVADLDARITGFYPYEAELTGAEQRDEAVIVFVREDSGEFEIKVEGPRGEHVVKLPGATRHELLLEGPGLTVVHGPSGRKALFAEPGVKILVKV